MAYASAVVLTVTQIARTGASVTKPMVAATATHGNKFVNDGRTFLRIKNAAASAVTVTITPARTIDGLALTAMTLSVAATGDADGKDDVLVGPFTSNFEQADGYVWATFSAVTTLTVGAFRL
jgi:hypothetical protein